MPDVSRYHLTDPVTIFGDFLRTKKLRTTPQRRCILEVFLNAQGHLSIEELYELVRREDSGIGQATIYRTMRLLCEAGLARELHFDDIARYEHAGSAHHDHLICESCGKNIEVVDPQIETLQVELARKHGFVPTTHRLYLYGICEDCLTKTSNDDNIEEDITANDEKIENDESTAENPQEN